MSLKLYYNTLKHLKWQQFWYRIPFLKKIGVVTSKQRLDIHKISRISDWQNSITSFPGYKESNSFTFLNKTKVFENDIDWDFSQYGLLWTYNLNYFEFLVQNDMSLERGMSLIDDFLEKYNQIKVAHDPYPISLRIIFWIKFFLLNNIFPSEKYLESLHVQAKELQGKLEYHLLGNHLLENAFALYFAGVYLGDQFIMQSATKLLKDQLNEQILADGAHFELSPMYHSIILYRLLDTINLTLGNKSRQNDILKYLKNKAALMLGWLEQISFKNGSFPLFNDAAYGISPSLPELLAYANRLGITATQNPLGESGYRKWVSHNFEVIIDVGPIGASYQAGHAHADTLGFVLNYKGIPLFVEQGTSTYEKGERRSLERSSQAHNTVVVKGESQSEVWGGFRVGKRANTLILSESNNHIEAFHDGYKRYGVYHKRRFSQNNGQFVIDDWLEENAMEGIAYYHFHPAVELITLDSKSFQLNQNLILKIKGSCLNIKIEEYQYSESFNLYSPAKRLEVRFKENVSLSIIDKS